MKYIFLVFILFILAACGGDEQESPSIILGEPLIATQGIVMPNIVGIIGDDYPIPRRVAMQMLEGLGFAANIIDEGMLTIQDAALLVAEHNPQGRQIDVTEENAGTYISYALWVELFMEWAGDSLELIDLIPFERTETELITNRGTFQIKSINLTTFFDHEIRVALANREILAVLGVTNLSPTIENALIVNTDAFGVTLFIGGTLRNYTFAQGIAAIQSSGVATVTVQGREVVEFTTAETIVSGRIERLQNHAIELYGHGRLPLCPNFAVYSLPAAQKNPRDLIVGEDMADFFIIDGRVGGAIITREITPTNIRVVLNTSGFTGLVHDSVTVTSTGNFIVRGGDRTEVFPAGHVFTVSAEENADMWGGLRLYISPVNPEYRLEISSITRNWAGSMSPDYRGSLEISPHNGGGFVIVNELCLEEYLFAVIPSEMPTAHGLEAAKVQAITARSFAMFQFYQNEFRAFGAHVDDSVISQVYNNIPETDISIQAVDATRGQVLSMGGELVTANYFSTSSGVTANFGEVWATGRTFPSDTPTHLRSVLQFDINDFNPGDLTQERYAADFFRRVDIPAYDRNFGWFRWSVRLTVEELSATINQSLQTRQNANPAMMQHLNALGAPTNERIATIGRLTDLEIIQRGQGGNIMEMIFTGTESTMRVRTEFNIRTFLNPGATHVYRHDGSRINNLTLLPSAFFTMEKEKDTNGALAAVIIFGGGNGHGVGMSQNGVRALVDRGLNYQEIIGHYYPGVEIINLQDVNQQ